MVLRQLQVVLHARRLVAGGDAAVGPLGLEEQAAPFGDLLGGENVRNLNEHLLSSDVNSIKSR